MNRFAMTRLLAGAALLAMSMTAIAETPDDDHAAHHPEVEATAPEGDAPDADTPMTPGMMGMMPPEMMQMMMRMMGEGGMQGMMGGMRGGPMAEGMPGHGMMGRGTMGQGMMGMEGMPTGPMMHGRNGQMGGHGLGPGALYGMPHGAPSEMTPARVEAFLSHLLERHGNPRLEIGEITEAEDGSIVAEIVTVNGSLVQRLAFNRYPGFFRQID
ncbi:hypothetical protein [Pararhodobacter sp. SW119]|uniref:hypothetical protein n=1 Tax=Pararhodobacter sp. SW119 TaxID=2780075 RepID=UPI001AE0664F|nr:hypothetical protein [Pararhodobacter sp. SW119]